MVRAGLPAVATARFDVVRSTTLPLARKVKQADFRRGLLYNRRISLTGIVAAMRNETSTNGPVTVVDLMLDTYTAIVKIPGAIAPEDMVGRTVRVTGLATNRCTDDGVFLEPELELSGVDAVDAISRNAMSAWALVSKACSNGIYGYREEFAKLPPEVQRAVGAPEVLREWAMMESDTVQSVIASNFQKNYRATQERQKELEKLPQNVRDMLAGVAGNLMIGDAQ